MPGADTRAGAAAAAWRASHAPVSARVVVLTVAGGSTGLVVYCTTHLPPGRPWGALPRPSWREMCGEVHDQTCRSARNRQNHNPRRCRGMRGTQGAARTRDLAAAAAPARVSAPGIALCSLGCISFHFDSAPPPTSRVASTHAAEANLNASRFCLHGGSCPTPPSCTTAACITHKGG